jgi:hypothetical protein
VSECGFIGPLSSTAHGADHIKNTYSFVRIVVLQGVVALSTENTALLFCVRWNVYTESLPSNGYNIR